LPFPVGAVNQPFKLGMTKAFHGMIVDHAYGLHEGVTDGGAHKVESPPLQVFAQGAGLRRIGGDLLRGAPGILPGHSSHKLPDVDIEACDSIASRAPLR